ncbi:uncharacterized protein [Penaeus vannamei]|uniref:Uncharacterized protein n=1 Tax=Penaeus vannamei TaxID=6689 RepID=A0A423T3L2_PENVA|nr:uncharacterized protein LOC113812625 [Penaeus vannamei]XP_027220341.1 uncharacterized protein LOC113812625 [Penaeus vannamei]ROT71087.1 hypothetical protein C7M84_010606 [Penaeus vannamei]
MSNDDLFDAVDALEQQQYHAGEEEGLEEGRKKHMMTGALLGWQQACHIQQELCRIEGLLESLLLNCRSDINPKLQTQMEKLLSTIRECPNWDPADEETMEAKLSAIHTKSRYILQRLKIPAKVIDRSVDGDF